jgi:hypothetical protein
MSYDATVYNVMIGSPGDVAAERDVARRIVSEWNAIHSAARSVVLLATGWDTHSSPAMGKPPQAEINDQVLKAADLLVCIFWTRIGTPTTHHASGTVEEIEEHLSAHKPLMLYFSSAPVHLASVDREQYEQLMRFKETVKPRGLYETFADNREFGDKFYRHLQLKLNHDPYFRRPPSLRASPDRPNLHEALSREARVLLRNVRQDHARSINRLTNVVGTSIQTNAQTFVDEQNPKDLIVWDAALRELEAFGLIEAANFRRTLFKLTQGGYELADRLSRLTAEK